MKKNLIFALLVLFLLAVSIGQISAEDNSTDAVSESCEEVILSESLSESEDGISDDPLVVDAKPMTVEYSKNKIEYSVKLTQNGSEVGDKDVELYFYDSEKSYFAASDIGGAATFNLPALGVGTYDFGIYIDNGHCVDSYIKVTESFKTPVKTKVSAPAVSVKKGDNKYFRVTVKDTKGKAVKNLKLKVKVYTDGKSKTYTVKTNGKGVASLSVKNFNVGTHKVEVSSANKNYKVSKTSKIVVKKKTTKYKIITIKLSKFDKDYIKKYGKYRIEAMKWKASIYQEVDITNEVKGNMYDRYKYLSKVYYHSGSKHASTPWKHGSVDCTYHKYQFGLSTVIDKVQIKVVV